MSERCPACLAAGRYFMIDLGLDSCDHTEAQKDLWRVETPVQETRPAVLPLWTPADPRGGR